MRLEEVDGEWLGRPLPKAPEPVGGDARWATAGGAVEPVGARAAEGVHASGDHLHAADVYAVDYAHAGSAQLGVQVAEDLVQGGGRPPWCRKYHTVLMASVCTRRREPRVSGAGGEVGRTTVARA